MIDEAKIKDSAKEFKAMEQSAKQFITELFGKQEQFQIEEVSRAGRGKTWIVTVSYFQKHKSPNDLQKLMGLTGSRIYKQLTIQENGTVLGVSNWSPASLTL